MSEIALTQGGKDDLILCKYQRGSQTICLYWGTGIITFYMFLLLPVLK